MIEPDSQPMNGFILAAGLGTRFRPTTLHTPKPLIQVAGKEVIVYSIELLKKVGVHEIVINTHHLAELLQKKIGDGSRWGMHIRYSHEPELLGTAGGLKKGASLFSQQATTVVLSSDVITNGPLEQVIDHHRKQKAEATMGLTWREDVTGAGIATFDENGRVTQFKEKPKSPEEVFSHWVNASLYVFEPPVIDIIPDHTKYDLSFDLFPRLVKENRLFYGYCLPKGRDYVIGIDSPELRDKAEGDILSGKVTYE